jgi:hypothetical protein
LASWLQSNGSNQASPLRLLHIRRAHWGIETGLHYRRDFTLKEDATRMTVGNMGKVMASINNLVLLSLDKPSSITLPKPDAGSQPIFPMLLPCSPPPFFVLEKAMWRYVPVLFVLGQGG